MYVVLIHIDPLFCVNSPTPLYNKFGGTPNIAFIATLTIQDQRTKFRAWAHYLKIRDTACYFRILFNCHLLHFWSTVILEWFQIWQIQKHGHSMYINVVYGCRIVEICLLALLQFMYRPAHKLVTLTTYSKHFTKETSAFGLSTLYWYIREVSRPILDEKNKVIY